MSSKPANQKRRNNEKRKEKSRVAARCRRNKEVLIFSELTAAIPGKKEDLEQLDKASVMRLAISYLRIRDVISMVPDTQPEQLQLKTPKALEDVASEVSYMKALDGFVLAVAQQGDIVYCSENIAEHIGVTQMEIMGQSIFEFSHPCDHEDVREALREGSRGRREILLRLKCTLTGKGRNVHLKSASYKVIRVTGHMLTPPDEKAIKLNKNNNNDSEDSKKPTDGDPEKRTKKPGCLIAVGRPIPHPSNIEIPLDSRTFLSKHSLDMKFTYTDDSLQNTLGFEPEELVGRSLYDYHHAGDSGALALQFKSLFSKGQCETGQYRFLAKGGGYSWVQTQATVITDKQQKPVSVVCVNYVVSGIECKDEVFAAHQLQHADLKPALALPALAPAPVCVPQADACNGAVVAIISPEERPIPVTELIFAPRNKEMNKGFLMFSPDEGTMLKDEPEDLTHLAPTAGDACIPLENNPFDMFDEFILNDNYCKLLSDELANSPGDSLGGDPLLLSSPDTQETDSSCEQSSFLTEISLDAFDSGRSDADLDGGKSPFIPMTDELPVLEPAVMWGALPENVSLARPQPSEPTTVSSAPALQRLLVAPPTGPPPQDLITNIYSDQGLIPDRSISSWDTRIKRVMKQEEEPTAKRVKRSPSPVQASAPKTAPSSSVLMNLLDLPQPPPQRAAKTMNPHVAATIGPNYQLVMNTKKLNSQIPIGALDRTLPIPNITVVTAPKSPTAPISNLTLRGNIPNPMSPLNIDCQMYPETSTYSPAISPARRERLLSPYSSPRSMSPADKFNQGYYTSPKLLSPDCVLQTSSDPYMSNKIQASPNYPLTDVLLGSGVSLACPDYWSGPELLQDTSDLLTAFDDVKLV